MIRKRLIVAMALVIAFVAGVPFSGAQAQQQQPAATPSKIAVLDLQRVLRDAVSVKDVNKQLATFREKFEATIKAERTALKEADQELGRQRQILSPEAFADERRKFEQKVRAAQLRADQRIRELEKVRNDAMLAVQRSLNGVVAGLAREKGFAMVIRSSQTVVVDSTLDLTNEVLARLDKELPTVKVAEPKPTAAQ